MESKLKQLIKEAILEALAEFMNSSASANSRAKEPEKGGPIEPELGGGFGGFKLDRP